MVTGQDVADFLGAGTDPAVVALADKHAQIVTAMARAYTRGNGFITPSWCEDDIAAAITTAAARLVANPEQIRHTVGGVQLDGFQGWTLPELAVLNRHRKRAL